MSWPVQTLGKLCSFENGDRGSNYPSKSAIVESGIPFVNAGHLEGSILRSNDLNYITEDHYNRLSNGKFKRGDFLFCLRGTLGKFGRVNHDLHGAIASSLVIIRPHEDLDARYLNAYLASDLCAKQIELYKNGAAQPNLAASSLKRFEIPLPPLDEQKRIAAILDQADELRRKRQRAIDRLGQLGQAIFHEMFLGDDGQRKPIKELGKVSTGTTPRTSEKENFDGPVPFVTPGDLESSEPVKRTLTEIGATKSRVVQQDATMVCCIGATIGKIDRSKERSAFNQQINAIEWSDAIHPAYGYYAMRDLRPVIIHKGKGASTTLPILKKSEFEKLKIPCPNLDQQIEFSKRLAAVERPLSDLIVARDWLADLFASLQHRAFQGEL